MATATAAAAEAATLASLQLDRQIQWGMVNWWCGVWHITSSIKDKKRKKYKKKKTPNAHTVYIQHITTLKYTPMCI